MRHLEETPSASLTFDGVRETVASDLRNFIFVNFSILRKITVSEFSEIGFIKIVVCRFRVSFDCTRL